MIAAERTSEQRSDQDRVDEEVTEKTLETLTSSCSAAYSDKRLFDPL